VENLDEQTMKDFLFNLLERKSLTDLFSKDWLLKFVSLVLAVILWYFVGGENRVDKTVMIPIEIINLPRDLVISNQFKKEIEVTVSGPRSLIQDMTSRALTRQIDLSSATPGTIVIENTHDKIPVLRGITIQRVQPSSIILSLDKLIQKQFPVEARTFGQVAKGYYVRYIRIDPDVITIIGPQTTLSQVDRLYTKPINLEGVKQSSQLQVPLDMEPAIVELIGETSVTADITIGLETVTKTMADVKVHAELNGVPMEVKPSEVKVVANIPKVLLDQKTEARSLFTLVAVKRDETDNLRVKAVPNTDLDIPIEILSIEPDTVKLVGEQPDQASQAQPAPKKSEVKSIPPAPAEPQAKAETGGPDSGGDSSKQVKSDKTKKK
jgi:YbbR domain-containing protein